MDSTWWRALVAAGLIWLPAHNAMSQWELSGSVSAEVRAFLTDPEYPRQSRHGGSIAAQPEFYRAFDDGRQSILFTPFFRFDLADSDRTHWDIRELIWERVADQWEIRAGIGKVFWGVTESVHLVDIINQTDLIENVDGEDKLGQPMVNVAYISDWGTVDLFVLPGFRERTFPGPRGRLRTNPVVDEDQATFESAAEHRHIDAALRWSHSVGAFDLGVSHFYGTSRDPVLTPTLTRSNQVVLVPHYDLIHQTGLDLQMTTGNWLFKFEGIRRAGQGKPFIAAAGGFEYTLVGVAGTSADLGILAEYLYDERGDDAPQPFEDDLFAGVRLAFNDAASTELLAGAIRDLDGSATVFSVEASRRLGDRWKVELEVRLWSDIRSSDPFFSVRNDDHIQLTVSRFF
ncbi:MAG: hypothetical protein AAF493_01815 [Pseudomonadota bacterium]